MAALNQTSHGQRDSKTFEPLGDIAITLSVLSSGPPNNKRAKLLNPQSQPGPLGRRLRFEPKL